MATSHFLYLALAILLFSNAFARPHSLADPLQTTNNLYRRSPTQWQEQLSGLFPRTIWDPAAGKKNSRLSALFTKTKANGVPEDHGSFSSSGNGPLKSGVQGRPKSNEDLAKEQDLLATEAHAHGEHDKAEDHEKNARQIRTKATVHTSKLLNERVSTRPRPLPQQQSMTSTWEP